MTSTEDKIKEVQEELDKTPRNKGTEHHVGKLRAKLARLRETREKRSSKGKTGEGYSIKKTGDARVVLVGFPSTGKSTLLNKITNADSKIAEYEFTTLDVIPGMMDYKGAKIQILDIPGIVTGASKGKGRGREVLSVIRSADLILIMAEPKEIVKIEIIKNELYDAGLRLNESKPNVKITRKDKGGIIINSTVKLNISGKTIKSILNEYSIHNAEVLIKEKVDIEKLIDVLMRNRVYIPMIVIINKIDLHPDNLEKIKSRIKDEFIFISAKENKNIEPLRKRVFEKLGLIRVYTKPVGKEVNLDKPVIIKKGSTITGLCNKIHKDFSKNFDYAKIWGDSVKFPGQRVSSGYTLKNRDIVQLALKKN